MGYLDNSTITVDAILTKRGRELLAQGRGSFNITQFALADDEIDYDLWNPAHPLGSDYYGVVIENMPITEAVPDETQSMKYPLITLPVNSVAIPFLQASVTSLEIKPSNPKSVDIETFYYGGGTPGGPNNGLSTILNSSAGYNVTLLDSTYVTMVNEGTTNNGVNSNVSLVGTTGTLGARTATSEVANVTPQSDSSKITINLQARSNVANIDDGLLKATKLIITGNETGGRVVIPITIRRDDSRSV
jgi:hypothetical protein